MVNGNEFFDFLEELGIIILSPSTFTWPTTEVLFSNNIF